MAEIKMFAPSPRGRINERRLARLVKRLCQPERPPHYKLMREFFAAGWTARAGESGEPANLEHPVVDEWFDAYMKAWEGK